MRRIAIDFEVMEPYTSKFNERIIKTKNCWNWKGKLNNTGYGQIKIKCKGILAHRYSYKLKNGDISPYKTIDHICRNRACVNPDHLEEVSRIENTMRGISPPSINHRKTHCIRGHLLIKNRRCNECRRFLYEYNKLNGDNKIKCGCGVLFSPQSKTYLSCSKSCAGLYVRKRKLKIDKKRIKKEVWEDVK